MSDLSSDKNTEGEGSKPSESDLSGKGWEILVGGKDNPFALGGSDPFDLTDASGSTRNVQPVKPSQSVPQPAPRDLSPEELGYQPIGQPSASSVDEMMASGLPGAVSSSSIPTSEEGTQPAVPGLSAGVTVTPIGPAIIEVAPAATPGVEAAPSSETSAATPASPSITELPPSSETPAPAATPVGGPIAPPEGQTPEDVMTGPVAPSSGPILSIPSTPPWPVPQSISIQDPFDESSAGQSQEEEGPELPPDAALAKALITQERIDALWNEINETYDLVINDVRGHYNTTQQALKQLKKARELLLSGPENFDNAEELVKEIKSRLRLEEKVRQWSGSRGAWLAAYLVMWFVLLSLSSLATNHVTKIAVQFVPDWMVATWLPGLFGGLGGVIGALWVLNKHITRVRDFDPIHTMWYITNPILGIALGVVTYLLVKGGGWLVTQVGNSGDFVMTPALTVALIVLCVIVGFNQNVLWALIDRFVKTVIPSTEGDEQAVTDETLPSSTEKPAG
jgi:hypothetical protein